MYYQDQPYYPDDPNTNWNYGGDFIPPPSGQVSTTPTQPAWTDPDTAAPDWLTDPNHDMSANNPGDGNRWSFVDGRWQIIPMPRATTPPPTTSTPPPTTYYGGGDGGYGGYGGGGQFSGSYPGGPVANVGGPPGLNLPRFGAPTPFNYSGKAPSQFAAPTMGEAEAEPGYAFRLDQGRKALEQSAAGKGVLRTGGTLKDLVAYGQNFASNEYGNVYNRRAGEHDRNYKEYLGNYDLEADTYSRNYGVSRDVFDRDYQAQLAEYQPKLVGWQQNATAQQRAAELMFGREWDEYVFNQNNDYQRSRDQIDDAYRVSRPNG